MANCLAMRAAWRFASWLATIGTAEQRGERRSPRTVDCRARGERCQGRQNPKYEARNPKQIQNTKHECPKPRGHPSRSWISYFTLNLFRISSFGFRVSRTSCFPPSPSRLLRQPFIEVPHGGVALTGGLLQAAALEDAHEAAPVA